MRMIGKTITDAKSGEPMWSGDHLKVYLGQTEIPAGAHTSWRMVDVIPHFAKRTAAQGNVLTIETGPELAQACQGILDADTWAAFAEEHIKPALESLQLELTRVLQAKVVEAREAEEAEEEKPELVAGSSE
jgi:hypothetical protein